MKTYILYFDNLLGRRNKVEIKRAILSADMQKFICYPPEGNVFRILTSDFIEISVEKENNVR